MSANDISLIAGAFVLVIGAVAAAVVAVLKALAELKKTAIDTAESARQAKLNTEQLEIQAHTHKVALALQIQENTKISEKAFHEANTVNAKLASLGLDHNALQKKEDRREERKELREERKDQRDERRELREEKKADDAAGETEKK